MFTLFLYEPGKMNEFVKDAQVEMTPEEAATANRLACKMRLHLRWWPVRR